MFCYVIFNFGGFFWKVKWVSPTSDDTSYKCLNKAKKKKQKNKLNHTYISFFSKFDDCSIDVSMPAPKGQKKNVPLTTQWSFMEHQVMFSLRAAYGRWPGKISESLTQHDGSKEAFCEYSLRSVKKLQSLETSHFILVRTI